MINIDRLKEISLKSANILVVGDVMIDEYYYGKISRISPEYPVPVFNYQNNKFVLGGAANVANNLRAINCNVTLLSAVGDDDASKSLIQLAQNVGINTDGIIIDSCRTTTIKTRLLNQNGAQVLRIDKEKVANIEGGALEKLKAFLVKNIASYDAILLSDYLKGVVSDEVSHYVIDLAVQHDKKVFVDVKSSNADKYRNAFLIKPNFKELSNLTPLDLNVKENISKACEEIKSKHGIQSLLVTLGAAGMMLHDTDNKIFNSKTKAKEVFDVTGAGDTVLSYIGALWAKGLTLVESMEIANYAAGIKVGCVGTKSVAVEEVIESIEKDNIYSHNQKITTFSSKIMNRESLLKVLDTKRDKKIVFTNGCFDILHLGHITYLEKAKEKGDIMIVGVNSDSSVKRLKGNSRPIVKGYERLALLAALSFVDYVVEFDEDTPLSLIEFLKPNVLIKGADYKNKQVVGSDFVVANGGKVELIDFVEGKSTTNVVDKIRDILKDEVKND